MVSLPVAPSRVRGLKLKGATKSLPFTVAPSRVRGLKHPFIIASLNPLVAPFTGAWIETLDAKV